MSGGGGRDVVIAVLLVAVSWLLVPTCLPASALLTLPSARSAIERGQWVLLDSANLCNPTVLDRLNPLLEPQGERTACLGRPSAQRSKLHGMALLILLYAVCAELTGQSNILITERHLLPVGLTRMRAPSHRAGVLLLNECGGGGGASARVVCPHPNFRLFLALDPR